MHCQNSTSELVHYLQLYTNTEIWADNILFLSVLIVRLILCWPGKFKEESAVHLAGFVSASECYIHMYVVCIACHAHARVMKAENSITLTIYQWKRIYSTGRRSENYYGFSWIYLPGLWIHNKGYEY